MWHQLFLLPKRFQKEEVVSVMSRGFSIWGSNFKEI